MTERERCRRWVLTAAVTSGYFLAVANQREMNEHGCGVRCVVLLSQGFAEMV